uniref:Uncharacterized protein n=1 Tax=Rhizophora mucronata TaxID=61149 RepID=A0A2P2NI58_RHIMU
MKVFVASLAITLCVYLPSTQISSKVGGSLMNIFWT